MDWVKNLLDVDMDLGKISNEILDEAFYSFKSGTTDETVCKIIEDIIKRKIVDVLEPEGVFEKGRFYDGHGIYIGIVDTYPSGADYHIKNHHFAIDSTDGRSPSKINQIFIREVKHF